MFFFFFQAEDGIRDLYVTGVQTCALPISTRPPSSRLRSKGRGQNTMAIFLTKDSKVIVQGMRSEEHTSELQSRRDLVCRLLLEKKNDPEFVPARPVASLISATKPIRRRMN